MEEWRGDESEEGVGMIGCEGKGEMCGWLVVRRGDEV